MKVIMESSKMNTSIDLSPQHDYIASVQGGGCGLTDTGFTWRKNTFGKKLKFTPGDIIEVSCKTEDGKWLEPKQYRDPKKAHAYVYSNKLSRQRVLGYRKNAALGDFYLPQSWLDSKNDPLIEMIKVTNIKSEIEEQEPEMADKESVKVLKECIDLQLSKSDDYQNPNSNVVQAMHYRRGVDTIHDIMAQKMLRAQSILESNRDPNFESLEDTYKDLINYASFAVSYMRGQMDGQTKDRDMFNRKINE